MQTKVYFNETLCKVCILILLLVKKISFEQNIVFKVETWKKYLLAHFFHCSKLKFTLSFCIHESQNMTWRGSQKEKYSLHLLRQLLDFFRCDYNDWRPGLALLLQPVPFPDVALAEEYFIQRIMPIVKRIGTDPRCQVHQMVLGPRDTREGWIQLISPSCIACTDKGETWTELVSWKKKEIRIRRWNWVNNQSQFIKRVGF